VAGILAENPVLAFRSTAILRDVMPCIKFLLGNRNGRDIAMTPLRVARIQKLFADIGEEGSEELTQALSMLSDMLSQYKGMRVSQIWGDIGK
jgi:hypothetical protein